MLLAGLVVLALVVPRKLARRSKILSREGLNETDRLKRSMEELLVQCTERDLHFDYVVLASSSGGTQAGLAVGARALRHTGRILGISVDEPADALRRKLAGLATATAEHLGLGFTFMPEDFAVDDGYLGGGYGVVGDLERAAIYTLARAEGILLDPVYTPE